MTVPHAPDGWRKSSWSTGSDTCVELAYAGAARDSKNPAGPTLAVDVTALADAAKAGLLDR